MTIRRDLGRAKETVTAKLPVLMTVPKSANSPRWPSARLMLKYRRARSAFEVEAEAKAQGLSVDEVVAGLRDRGLFIETWGAEDIHADLGRIGISGSPTKVKKIENVVLAGRNLKLFNPDDVGVRDLINELDRREDVRLIMSQHGDVWVFAEVDDGKVADVSLELLGKGRDLAGLLGVKVGAVILGHHTRHLGRTLFTYGADIVYSAEHPALAAYTTLPYARVLTDLVADKKPEIVLYGASPVGRDLAPRVASSLRTGLTADCTDLQIGTYESGGRVYQQKLLQIRPAWGGNIIATIVSPDVLPEMATVREGVIARPRAFARAEGVMVDVKVALDSEAEAIKVLERHPSRGAST